MLIVCRMPMQKGSFGDPTCGDYLTIYIKVKDNRISEISFLFVFGCAVAIATSSMTTVLAKGKILDEALEISQKKMSYMP